MGKCLQNQDPISPKNPPGCMWGIFHNLNHNQHRKRLPHKRKGGGKRVAVVEDLVDNATADVENSSIVSKTIETNHVSKSSMLSRIRSLIAHEETSKRKSRHRRSSSCPVELEQTSSIRRLDLADLKSSHEIPLNDKTLEHPNYKEKYSVASLLDPPPKKICECAIQKPMKLDNMRKDSSKLMLDFIKLVSFPSRRSRGRKAAKGENYQSQVGSEVSGSVGFNSHSVTSTDFSSDDDVGKHMLVRRDNASLCLPRAEKKESESSKLILDRFKNLKQKVRHALEESRKERHRIVMDAVLHKVPHGHKSSKDIEKGISTFANCNSTFTKSEMKFFRRTSSVNESLDRYNRSHNSCFYREEKHHISDRSSFTASSRSPSPARSSPIGLERILSMPDLRYYNSFKHEDSPERVSSYTLDRESSSNNLYVGISKSNEQKSRDIFGSEDHTEECYKSDSRSTIFLDVSESFDDFGSLKTRENSSSIENIIEGTSSVVSNTISVPISDMNFQNSTSGAAGLSAAKGAEEDAVNTDEKGFSSTDLNRILQIQVDKRYSLEFNYIKDVLELSGFSGNKFLGKWHSTEKPVNPSLFDEVEGYCLLDQDGVACDQLLLFDLINEVLLQIYERSCSYWPKSLTCRSYMHTMPVGYHVLGEVWKDINSCLESEMKIDQQTDDIVSRDLAKDEAWMNLQFDAVCVGLEMEDLILNDLLEELVFT